MGTGCINIVVACKSPAGLHRFAYIREWSQKTEDPVCRGAVGAVRRAPDLRAALRVAPGEPGGRILVCTGYGATEAREEISRWAPAGMEAIVLAASLPVGAAAYPSASLFEAGPVVASGDPVPFLRKAILRLRARQSVRVLPIASESDLRAYFALRYRVWKDLGYIPPGRDCPNSQLEVDYTDRTAEPVGAFAPGGELVGCSRLVHEIGAENRPLVRLINGLIRQQGDPCLARNFAYPAAISHPFDVLESFPGFRRYYQGMVRQGVSKAEVSRVIVRPESRGEGLGEVIVDSLVSLAACEQTKVLFLACLEKHRSFYERCGFRVVPDLECDAFVNVRVPAIAMERHLA